MAKKKNKDANKNAKRTKIICLINDEAYRDNSYEENMAAVDRLRAAAEAVRREEE